MEEGTGPRVMRYVLLLLVAAALTMLYGYRAQRNFASPEAMDAAQLGRNLAEGRGFKTQYVRPFSLYLLERRANDEAQALLRTLPANRDQWLPEQREAVDQILARASLREGHYDVSNPPLYPLLLAGLMKVLPFDFNSSLDVKWVRFQPEVIITLFNQLLFVLALWLTFGLARHLFDDLVAWLTVAALLGSELLWRFSASGLSTMLLLVLFLGVTWCLVKLEQGAEEGLWSQGRLALVAGLAGLLVGLGTMTRYSFAWLLIPVTVFIGAFINTRRSGLYLACLLSFAAVTSPWIKRNYDLTGTFFGTASYSVYEGTQSFPENRLERSLEPDFNRVEAGDIPDKLIKNLREILTHDLPLLGGSWFSAFFLVGLLVPFKSQALGRMRIFVLLTLAVFALVQALGRTHLSDDTGQLNSDNLLVLASPLVFCCGAALFSTLLGQVRVTLPELRSLILGVVVLVLLSPFVLGVVFTRANPLAYPPYYPPKIRMTADWMGERELMMSDMPWAVAWYGHRPCVLLTLNSDHDFRAIHQRKPVQALYLTQLTLDGRFLSDWIRGDNVGWGVFIVEVVLRREVPTGFPLQRAPTGFMPDQLFLADWERW
jgi:4-amino-4-deoxy-L-arabinose transferase-like glycosyltransferase